jgi:hypothetical protein
MKRNLSLVILLIISVYGCKHLKLSTAENTGGLLIIYTDTSSSQSLVLLENDLKIEPSNKKLVPIKNLKPGQYTLLVKGTKKKTIKEIHVAADSLSIVPLYYFENVLLDSLIWDNTNFNQTKLPSLFWLYNNEDQKTIGLLKKIHFNESIPSANFAGKVVDLDTKKPITEAIVTFKDYPWWGTKVDSNGHFCISDIIPGDYIVFADHRDFHREYVGVVTFYDSSTSMVEFSLISKFNIEEPLPRQWDGLINKVPCN